MSLNGLKCAATCASASPKPKAATADPAAPTPASFIKCRRETSMFMGWIPPREPRPHLSSSAAAGATLKLDQCQSRVNLHCKIEQYFCTCRDLQELSRILRVMTSFRRVV